MPDRKEQTHGTGESGNEQREKHMPQKRDPNRVPPPPDAEEKNHSGYYAQTFEDSGDTTPADSESPQPPRDGAPASTARDVNH